MHRVEIPQSSRSIRRLAFLGDDDELVIAVPISGITLAWKSLQDEPTATTGAGSVAHATGRHARLTRRRRRMLPTGYALPFRWDAVGRLRAFPDFCELPARIVEVHTIQMKSR